MTPVKHIPCPLPERKAKGDEMKLSYCREKCEHRESCEAWREHD